MVVALQGDYGKALPALVLQSDFFSEHSSVTLAPVTSTLIDAPLFRITVEPSKGNGLRTLSQIMVDKLTTVRRDRITDSVGHLSEDLLLRVNRALLLWLGVGV